MGLNDKYRECDQTQKAYQKQDAIFVAAKASKSGGKKAKSMRYHKTIGLGFKTPKAAVEANYVDKKCPFTGNVSIRGRILKGLVTSTKMTNTIVVRRDYLHYITKYRRYEKRHKNIHAHASPAFGKISEGDVVTIGQCRPLAKTVRFNVIDHVVNTNKALNVRKIFRMF